MNTASTVLKDLGISEKHAIREFALLNSSQKAAEFEQECEAFENKYKMSFQELEQRLQSTDVEVFEQEDDYLAWKFAVEGARYWRKKTEQLKSES
ncbi:MAG: hypothetical protein ACE5G1_04085 [bacterium]